MPDPLPKKKMWAHLFYSRHASVLLHAKFQKKDSKKWWAKNWDRAQKKAAWRQCPFLLKILLKKEKIRGWKKKSPTHGLHPFTDQNRSSVSTSRSISLRSDRIADLYDLHKARYISWVGSVLYRSCAVSHNGRYGSRWILAREPFSLLQRFPRAIFE